MAEGKNSFVLYTDQKELFMKLSDEQAGQLIKHIYKYVTDEHPETDDILLDIAFTPIKQQLKRDLVKFEEVRKKRREAGKQGGRPKQSKAKKANALYEKQSKTKKAVNENVNENVSDTVNVNENKKLLMSEANASNVTEKNKNYFKIAESFYKLFEENSNRLDVKWVHLKKISAKKFIDPIRLMVEVDGRTEEELRKVYMFLKRDEFWMPNIQGSNSLREKFDKLITKAKTMNGTKQSINWEAV